VSFPDSKISWFHLYLDASQYNKDVILTIDNKDHTLD